MDLMPLARMATPPNGGLATLTTGPNDSFR